MVGGISKFEKITVAIAVLILVTNLLVTPVLGLANNGDFERIMYQENLDYTSHNRHDIYFNYIHKTFIYNDTSKKVEEGYFSSHVLLLKAAEFINYWFSKNLYFDIRSLGFVQGTLLVSSLIFGIFALKKQNVSVKIAYLILFVFMFLDVGYIAYLNSFYSEAATFVFLLLFISYLYYVLFHRKFTVFSLFFLGVLICLFLTAKLQNSPLGLVAFIIFVRLSFVRKDVIWKFTSILLSFVVLFISYFTYQSSPKELSNVTVFDSFFKGVLTSSYSVESDLEEFGVDSKYKVLAGNAYYIKSPIDVTQNNKEFKKDFYDKVTHKDIIVFYLKHPHRLFKAMEITSDNTFELRPDYLGNFEKKSFVKPKQKSEFFGLYNEIRAKVFPKSFVFLIAYFGLYFIFLFYKWIRSKDMFVRLKLEAAAVIIGMAIVQFPIPIVSEGENELLKHLFLFNSLFDISLLVAILFFVNFIHSRFFYKKNR